MRGDYTSSSELFQVLEFQPEAKLAVGWNSIENDISTGRATCLDPKSFSYKKNPSGHKDGQYEGSFRLVHSKTDIEDGFGLNASATYRGLLYKVEGSAKYAQSKEVSAENTNVAGYVAVETRADSIYGATSKSLDAQFIPSVKMISASEIAARFTDIRVLPEYIDLLASNPKEFFRRCGDGFVADIYYGGRLNVLAALATTSEDSKKKLEASLKGSSSAVDVSVDGFISSVKKSSGTQFTASYRAVGGDGKELSVSSIDNLKQTVDKFSHEVFKNDAGIRMRVVSYASLIPNTDSYRFGVVQDAIDAARRYRDLNSVWDALGQMRDGPLTTKLKWNRAVSKQCLADKQDEILDYNKTIFSSLETCSKQMNSSMSNPPNCSSKALLAGARLKTGSATCPATTTIVDGKLSQFDYRLFYPLVSDSKILDICQKPSDSVYRAMINKLWLKPTIDAQCSADPNQPQCYNRVREQLTNNIHILDNGFTPIMPTGGYTRSCKNCETAWRGDGGSHVRCDCKKNGKYVPTKWRNMDPQCPQKTALQNCSATLKYGNC
ncbi:MAG: hypothetical protein R3E73_11265 [Porticoccaceae bacterium]